MGSALSTPQKLKLPRRSGRPAERWLWAGEIAGLAGLPVACVRRHLVRGAPYFARAKQREVPVAIADGGSGMAESEGAERVMEWCAPEAEVRLFLGSKVEAHLSITEAAALAGFGYDVFALYVRRGLVRSVVHFGRKLIPESALNELPREVPVELRMRESARSFFGAVKSHLEGEGE